VSPRRSSWQGGFPPSAPRRPGPSPWRAKGKRPFGETWWGRAWVDALEGRSRLDQNRLPRGRTYARTGAVGEVTVAPGIISAPVQGSRATPYRVRIGVTPFTEAEWDRVLDAMAAEIGHVAALLDGELLPAIADDVRSAGVDLLPGPGDLVPRCSCPDWADPCKHAAAVCYVVADSLDEDPFGLFLMRGRSRAELLDALRARRGGGGVTPGSEDAGSGRGSEAVAGADADVGLIARDAWQAHHAGVPVPRPVAVPRHAGRPTVLAADPPADSGVDLAMLRAVATDAAERALALARGLRASALDLSPELDLARGAARLIEAGESVTELAHRAAIAPRALERRARAWILGGAEGVAVLDQARAAASPDDGAVAGGIELLGAGAVARGNRVTLGRRQLRLGRDGRWYPFQKDSSGQWFPEGPPLDAPPFTRDTGALDDIEID
jgi:uncharacterized Zn finger protein